MCLTYLKHYISFTLIVSIPLLVSSKIAWAGDPCPLAYTLHDYGVPPWLDRQNILQSLESKAHFVGITYQNRNQQVVITHILDHSPAQIVGLQVNDQILNVNQKDILSTKMLSEFLDRIPLDQALRFTIYRDKREIQFVFKRRHFDPVLNILHRWIEQQDCSIVHLQTPKDSQKKKDLEALFLKNKRFNCKTAHKILTQESYQKKPGDLLFIRGSKRIMLVHPGYQTLCIRSNQLDGEQLTVPHIQNLFIQLTSAWKKSRFQNP